MTQEEWFKKAGAHLPEGGYNIQILDKCVFMFREGYKDAIKDVCEWLDNHMCNKNNGIKVKDYQSVGELIYNLRKEIWE